MGLTLLLVVGGDVGAVVLALWRGEPPTGGGEEDSDDGNVGVDDDGSDDGDDDDDESELATGFLLSLSTLFSCLSVLLSCSPRLCSGSGCSAGVENFRS
jgi:hypothetical protein